MPARSLMDRYSLAAPIYDFATLAWSGGAIWRTRARALSYLSPGSRVLIPGAGTGRLSVEAARLGATVTALEPSPAMRSRAERRAARALGTTKEVGSLTILDQRLEAFVPPAPFDVVVAEHFLNVFDEGDMPLIRDQLVELVAPGGVLVIADFTPLAPGASRIARAAQSLHHVIPLGGCALLTANAMHPIYDHGEGLGDRDDLRLESQTDEPSFHVGPRWFRTWTFAKLSPQR